MTKPPRTSMFDAIGSAPTTEGIEGYTNSPFVENPELKIDGPLGFPVTVLDKPREFDFGDVPAEALAEIKSLQHAIVVKLTAAIIAVGKDLLRLQELIELHCVRGTWSRFLDTGLPFSESSARNYMRAARSDAQFEDGATVAENVSPTALYEARNAPAEVLKEIERRAALGQTVTGQDVRNMLFTRQQHAPAARVVDASVVAEPDTRSGGMGESAEGLSLAPVEPTLAASPMDAKSSRAAATELVSRLRDHFEDDTIAELDDLWQTAGPGTIRSLLSA